MSSLDKRRILVDCGLFQGFKQLRRRNRKPFPVRPGLIDTLLLTHAHLDHSGYIPALVSAGFRGNVICTEASRELCGLILPDSGHIQEEEARYARRKGFSKHKNPTPLYTLKDAEAALEQFQTVRFDHPVDLGDEITARPHPSRPSIQRESSCQIRRTFGGTVVHFGGNIRTPG